MLLFEVFLAGFSICGWVVSLLAKTGILPLAGGVDLDLYRYYSLAAVLGWGIGNIYMFRWRHETQKHVRRLALFLYLLGPPSFLYILRALAPLAAQQAAPLVPNLGFAIYGIFFLVPLTLRPTPRRRR